MGAVIPTEGRMGGGPYVGLGLIVPTKQPWLAFRVSGGVGFTEHLTSVFPEGELSEASIIGQRAESQHAYDLSVSLLLQRPAGELRPYLAAGVGYYRLAPGSEGEPLLYGAGLNAGLGATARFGPVDLGLEFGFRVFGGYTAGTSGERSFAPFTVTFGW